MSEMMPSVPGTLPPGAEGRNEEVGPQLDALPMDGLIPGVGVPEKRFEMKEGIPLMPSNREKARKLSNPYPKLVELLKPIDAALASFLMGEDASEAERFGVENFGKLEQLAIEHDLGELEKYCLLGDACLIIGSAKALRTDKDLKDIEVLEIYSLK